MDNGPELPNADFVSPPQPIDVTPSNNPGEWSPDTAQNAAMLASYHLSRAAFCEGLAGHCNSLLEVADFTNMWDDVRQFQPQVADEFADAVRADKGFPYAMKVATLNYLDENIKFMHDPRTGPGVLKEELEQFRDGLPENTFDREFLQNAIDNFDAIRGFQPNDWNMLWFTGNETGITSKDLERAQHEVIPTQVPETTGNFELAQFIEANWSDITQHDQITFFDLYHFATTSADKGDKVNEHLARTAATFAPELSSADMLDAGMASFLGDFRYNAKGITQKDVDAMQLRMEQLDAYGVPEAFAEMFKKSP